MFSVYHTFTMFTKLYFLFCTFLVFKSAGALQCYVCGFSSVDTDRSCLAVTNSTQTVECTMKYCTIMRQEFQDPAGAIVSFVRGCDDSPPYLNHEVSDPTFRSYYRACTFDLCNIGNGIQRVDNSNILSPYPMVNYTNLLVPGT